MTDKNVTATEADTAQFSLGKIYVKDLSLEAPNAPATFLNSDEWEQKVSLHYKTDSAKLSDDTYEVILHITASATVANQEKTIFLVELQQAGIFLMSNIGDQKQLDKYLNIRCPKILFPYARETIDTLIMKAGFPPLLLAPLNFANIFKQQQAALGNGS